MIRHASRAHVPRRSTVYVLKDVLINCSLVVADWSSEGMLV